MHWLRTVLALLLLTLLAAPAAADEKEEQQAGGPPDFRFEPPRVILGLRGGWAFNRSNGEIYDFLTETLTLSDSDFDAPALAIDASVPVTSWMDVVVGFEFNESSNDSELRNFTDQFGAPIEQKTRLTQVPLTLSLKLYPLGRGRQVGRYAWVRSTLVPYIGGGIGGTWFELKQEGSFVDFTDLSVFEAELKDDGWAFARHVFVGLDYKLTRNIGMVLEGRYYWGDADLGGDFVGFKSLDLSGARVMFGFSWRL